MANLSPQSHEGTKKRLNLSFSWCLGVFVVSNKITKRTQPYLTLGHSRMVLAGIHQYQLMDSMALLCSQELRRNVPTCGSPMTSQKCEGSDSSLASRDFLMVNLSPLSHRGTKNRLNLYFSSWLGAFVADDGTRSYWVNNWPTPSKAKGSR